MQCERVNSAFTPGSVLSAADTVFTTSKGRFITAHSVGAGDSFVPVEAAQLFSARLT